MACCVFTAYFMSQVIKMCELFHIRLLEIKYNEFDPESDFEGHFGSYSPQGVSGDGAFIYDEARRPGDGKNELSDTLKTTRLAITGITCSACVSTLTQVLTSHPHIVRMKISLP